MLRRGYYNLMVKMYNSMSEMEYPIVRKDFSYVDNFHGVELFDFYRWLENPNTDETRQFIENQNKISRNFIEAGSDRHRIEMKLTKLWNYPKYSCPTKHGDYYYFYANTGLQNQNVLFQQKQLVDQPKVFLDPNTWSADGTVALSQKSFSEDGNYMAYGISENGSDWLKIKIRDVKTGDDLKETLEKVKFSEISWTIDNKGFFYAKYDQVGSADGAEVKQNENQKLYYHYVGKNQNEDILIAEFPEEPSWRMQAVVSDCGRYLIMPIVKGCRDNLLYYIDLNEADKIQSGLNVIKVIDKFEYDYEYITNVGPKMYFRTNKNSPNYRIVIIDLESPSEEYWETIIPEQKGEVLDWAKCVDSDKLLLCYMQDVKSVLQANFIKTGKLVKKFPLDIGTVVAVSGKKKYSEIFFNFSSFLNPGTIYQYDFGSPNKQIQIFRESKLQLDGFSQYDYEIKQIFYNSKDGTKIPMFIIHKKKEIISPQPCLLYGYGGFNISLQPSFSATGLMFMNTFDGILAYPNLRGGGEYGEKWHNAGRLLNKQNVFDDFQKSAEYLIRNNYTTKDRLVIQGGSNGGLLVAACINQRPDLFGAAVAQVGVMDMLRFHKFTIGHAWCSDYGNPNEKEHFENLLKYSPLHNIHVPKKKCEEYPSTLILTADHDDRVSPLHSLKFAASLQDAVRDSVQENPIILRVYSKAGHGAGKPTSKRIEESADILTFIRKTINVDVSVLQANFIKTGKLVKKFPLDIGTVVAVSGKKKYSEIFFNFSSFLNPGTIYQYDFGSPNKQIQIFRESKLQLDGFSQYDYEIKQIFYNSKDGTKIPMFIIHKKKEIISPQPCLLYGYGGFNISLQPSFSATGLMFMNTFDGILAYPNLRGGGEYGEKWHNAGRLLNKQNVFDDFQKSAEYLIRNNYTTKDRLVIQGGSNGGLLVAACINQRPDLFGAAVAQVGVMDMLRFHKFTIGHAWCSDYGNPNEKEHFENLLKYSPLHNIHVPKKKCEEYPSTLILTADHDDRVSPLHSLKFAASLQDAVRDSVQENPIILRVYSKAGHGAGKPTSKRIEESADILTFIRKTINVDVVNL